MKYECIVYLDSGQIIESHASPEPITFPVWEDGWHYLEARGDGTTEYVKDRQVVPRPIMDLQVSGKTLAGVPAGAVITIDGVEYTADGSDIELDFSLPGKYRIRVSCWPYINAEVVYEAQASL
jgi:hypothetical protein